MKRRIQKAFLDHGYGFPLILRNVPMIYVRGVWTPDVNYNELRQIVLRALASKPARLTGDEISFIRQASQMTVEAFARRFAVSHPAVLKWEKRGGSPTPMNWATEKDIRLFILSRLGTNAKDVVILYEALETEVAATKAPLRIDVETETKKAA